MKSLIRVSREVAKIIDGDHTVPIVAGEGVNLSLLNGDEPIETVAEALLIGSYLKETAEDEKKRYYAYYDRLGLRITEYVEGVPEGALVIDYGHFFVYRVVPKPPPPTQNNWKFRVPPRKQR